jgi:cytochrome c oxidase assembly factor CtaG
MSSGEEARHRTGAPAPATDGRPGGVAPRRRWLAALGVALAAASLLPPVVTAAHSYVFAETIQFVTFALAAPALIVLGAPWRLLGLDARTQDARTLDTRGPGIRWPGIRGPRIRWPAVRWPVSGRLVSGRPSGATPRGPSPRRPAVVLLVFMGVCLAWRLPPVVDALSRHPPLLAAELVTLLPAGTALWLELVSSPPFTPRLRGPQRAAVAALAMWSVWIVAYLLGLSNDTVFHAYDPAGGLLSPAADQEISAALCWGAAGLCLVPVVFVAMLGWLARDDPDKELARIARTPGQRPTVKGWGRPAPRP